MVIPAKGIALFLHINSSDGGDNRFNLSGMLDLIFSSNGSGDNFDVGELTSFTLPALLSATFGNSPHLQLGAGACNELLLPGEYVMTRPMSFAALAPRLLGRLALPEIGVVNNHKGLWTIDSRPYRRSAACQFVSTGDGYAQGNISEIIGFAVLADGDVVGGPHTLTGWTKLKWYEHGRVVALPYLLALFLLPFALIAARGADRMAKCALKVMGASGFVLLICVLLEMEYSSKLVQDDGQAFPAMFWRFGWHLAFIGIGVGLIRSARVLGTPDTKLWQRGLVGLMAACGITALLLSGYWGLFGTLTGNNFS